jgi:PLD-like domain
VAAAEEQVWLVSPFLTAPIAATLAAAVAGSPTARKRLLTDLDPRAVRCGSLDPKALSTLLNAGFEIRSIANLHAKVALVDSRWGLIGSGNLTGAGLGGEGGRGNYEMGTILSLSQLEAASRIVLGWWKRAAEVDAEQVAIYAALPKLPKEPIGSLGPLVEPPRTAKLEEILEEDPETAASRCYWINSNYHDPANEYWWRRNWVSDGGNKSYDVGDLLVIYLGKTNKGPQLCPAVLRVAETCRYDREFVLAERDLEAAERWPYVTRTSFVAEVPPSMGAPLALAGKTYLSVENGCELTRAEFESLAQALLI